MTEQYFYDYPQFKADVKTLKTNISLGGFAPDAIVAISRGGWFLGAALAYAWDLRPLLSIHAESYDQNHQKSALQLGKVPDLTPYQKVLIVDDLADSGETLKTVDDTLKSLFPLVDLKIATIFQKPFSTKKPDFFLRATEDWVVFFHEIDYIEEGETR